LVFLVNWRDLRRMEKALLRKLIYFFIGPATVKDRPGRIGSFSLLALIFLSIPSQLHLLVDAAVMRKL